MMMVMRGMMVMVMVMGSWSANILGSVVVEAQSTKRVVVGGLSSADNRKIVVWLMMVMVMAAVRQLSEGGNRVGIILMAMRMMMMVMCRMSMLCPLRASPSKPRGTSAITTFTANQSILVFDSPASSASLRSCPSHPPAFVVIGWR